MPKKLKITICIPTFNRLKLLKGTIRSVLAQTEKPDEILVGDNCSDKPTWEYLKSLKGIRLYQNKKNIGSFENFNKLIRLAKSEYITILCSDDLISSDYIKIWKSKIAETRGKAMAYFSSAYAIDIRDRIIGLTKPFPQDTFLTPPNSIKFFWDHHWFHLLLPGWTVYKKEIFEKIGYITRKYGRAPETEITMKIVPYFPVFYSAEPVFANRIHGQQGFEKKPGDAGGNRRQFIDIGNSFKVFFDYEKDPQIRKAFTKKDQEERIFVRQPMAFLLPQSLFCLLTLNFWKAKGLFNLFKKYYPRPIFSWVTIRLVMSSSLDLVKRFLRNIIIRLKRKNSLNFVNKSQTVVC